MSNNVDIPEDLLERFENGQEREADFSGEDAETVAESIDNLNDTIKFALNWFDDSCKEKGLPGTGDVDNAKMARLTSLVARRNIPTRWLEKSPEGLLVLTVFGIGANNYIALKRIKKQKQSQQAEAEAGNE